MLVKQNKSLSMWKGEKSDIRNCTEGQHGEARDEHRNEDSGSLSSNPESVCLPPP